jgi:pyruvate/2-oxoglutarate dehydrogenase complex dihydrolipoamide acyltransferase (E2) component
MRLPNQLYLARLKRTDRPSIRHFAVVFLLTLIFLAGCAGGAGSSRFSNLFGGASPAASPSVAEIPIAATPTPTAAPAAAEAPARTSKKVAKQARAASENAATASKEAANASAAAALASKQAASVANRIEGSGPSNADVSLESNPALTAEGAPVSAARNRATPASSPVLTTDASSVTHSTPTMSSPALDTPGVTGESNPATAARLIQNVDAMDRRVDRKNLTADDSQRDILAQRLLQKAKKALEDRDSVAAMSLATKASTLFAPLPKLTASSIAPAP